MDYKPFLTTDENGERNDKNSYNEILDRNRIKIAEGVLDRHESMIKQLLGDDSNLTETTDSAVAYMKQVPANALNYAELLNVGGMCQKVNQLVSSVSSTSGTINAGEYKELATAKVGGYHKLLVIMSVSSASLSDLKWRVVGKDASDNFKQVESAASVNAFMAELKNYDSTDGLYIRLVNASESSVSYSNASVMLIDLTAIYGAGNEPATTSDARIQWLMSYLASHPEYDAGSIITAPVTKVVSKGFNLWDEEWEIGTLNSHTGEKDPSDNNIRSKNYISVSPNTAYYMQFSAANTGYAICFYDKANNFIAYIESGSHSFTTPLNCHYLRFRMFSSYGTTYNHDICINRSSSLNGTYMPYRAPIEYPIPAEVRALEGYGWGFNAECNNYASYERKMYVKVMRRVDLGSLNWTYNSVDKVFNSSSLPDIKPSTRNTLIMSAPYVNIHDKEGFDPDWDKVIYTAGTAIRIMDSAYNDATAFKTAMSGNYAYYELATPVETDISEYLPYDDYIEVEGGGSVIFENENEIDVPSEIVYLEEVSE